MAEVVLFHHVRVFVYPGDQHLLSDSSMPSYDRAATEQVIARSRAFLDRLG